MKEIVVGTLIFLAGAWAQSQAISTGPVGSVLTMNGTEAPIWTSQVDQMTVPKVTHTKVKHEIVDEVTTRECPAGYEGHFVDIPPNFEAQMDSPGITWGTGYYTGSSEGAPAYALCFKKDFMDMVRKTPDVSTHRPVVRAVEYQISPGWRATPNLLPVPIYLPSTGIGCPTPATRITCISGTASLPSYTIGDFPQTYR